jgi:hypothetical protein
MHQPFFLTDMPVIARLGLCCTEKRKEIPQSIKSRSWIGSYGQGLQITLIFDTGNGLSGRFAVVHLNLQEKLTFGLKDERHRECVLSLSQ